MVGHKYRYNEYRTKCRQIIKLFYAYALGIKLYNNDNILLEIDKQLTNIYRQTKILAYLLLYS
jgi:hypothetical protein